MQRDSIPHANSITHAKENSCSGDGVGVGDGDGVGVGVGDGGEMVMPDHPLCNGHACGKKCLECQSAVGSKH